MSPNTQHNKQQKAKGSNFLELWHMFKQMHSVCYT